MAGLAILSRERKSSLVAGGAGSKASRWFM
jgi:hypothetical protein